MRKLAITLAATALVLGSAFCANAQTQQPGSLQALSQIATPLAPAACGPHFGRWCGPWHHRVCGPYRCWCAHC
jgi:hypothetical protein